jgi:hypothetical protein
MKMAYRRRDIPCIENLFGVRLAVIDTDDHRELSNQFGIDVDEVFAFCTPAQLWDGDAYQRHILIVINTKWEHQPVTEATIAHECLHACDQLADMIGSEGVSERSEFQTHVFEHIFEEALKFYSEGDMQKIREEEDKDLNEKRLVRLGLMKAWKIVGYHPGNAYDKIAKEIEMTNRAIKEQENAKS